MTAARDSSLSRTRPVQVVDRASWLVPADAADLALQLHGAGIDVELGGRLAMLRRRLAKVVDGAVKLLLERTGTGFAGSTTPEELATAGGAAAGGARRPA